jgi:hypothetical protein
VDDLERYSWIDDPGVFDAGCVSVVVGVSEDDVIKSFGLDGARTTVVTGNEAFDLQRPGFEVVVQLGRLDEAVVAFEPNGYEGSKHRLATELSSRGRYVSYYAGAMGVTELVYAERGSLLRSFEPLLYRNDGEPARALPVRGGLAVRRVRVGRADG